MSVNKSAANEHTFTGQTMVSQELKKTLWAAADKLRSNMDAAEYKHIALGLIFLKYVSDTFSERQVELRSKFADPDDE